MDSGHDRQMTTTPRSTEDEAPSGLFDALRKLESRLLDLMELIGASQEEGAAADPFRGLYISQADVFRDLTEPADRRRSIAAAGFAVGLLDLGLAACPPQDPGAPWPTAPPGGTAQTSWVCADSGS